MLGSKQYVALVATLVCMSLLACGKATPPATGKLLPAQYTDDPPPFSDWKQGDWGYVNARNEWVVEPQFERAAPFREGLAAVRDSGKWGWVDPSGEFVIPPKYAFATDFDEDGMALVSEIPDEPQVAGAVTVAPELGDAEQLAMVLAHAERHPAQLLEIRKGGFIDRTGAHVIPLDHDAVQPFRGGLAAFAQDGEWGYLDRFGIVIIQPQFEAALPFDASGTWAPVQSNGKWGFVDRQGQFLVEPSYTHASHFDEERLVGQVWGGTGQGLLRSDGTMLAEPEFMGFDWANTLDIVEQTASAFLEGTVPVPLYIGSGIRVASTEEFMAATPPRTAFYVVISPGQGPRPEHYSCFGGRTEGQCYCSCCPEFNDGLAPVCIGGVCGPGNHGGKYGYIDTTGHLVILARFDTAAPFKDGIATVTLDGQRLRIDREGNVLGPAEEQ